MKAAQRNLAGHLAEFIGDLKSKGLNSQYVNEFENRLLLLMDECRWQLPQDMTADSFVAWRSSSKDRAPKTLNEYLTCAKGFANWLLAQGRIASNQLASIKPSETRGREVRPRRAYGDASLLPLRSAVEKLSIPASQIASQKLVAEGHSLTAPVAKIERPKRKETPVNKREMSVFDAACHVLTNIQKWCVFMNPLEPFFRDNSLFSS